MSAPKLGAFRAPWGRLILKTSGHLQGCSGLLGCSKAVFQISFHPTTFSEGLSEPFAKLSTSNIMGRGHMISGGQNHHHCHHPDREPLSQTLLVGKHGPYERWMGKSHLC